MKTRNGVIFLLCAGILGYFLLFSRDDQPDALSEVVMANSIEDEADSEPKLEDTQPIMAVDQMSTMFDAVVTDDLVDEPASNYDGAKVDLSAEQERFVIAVAGERGVGVFHDDQKIESSQQAQLIEQVSCMAPYIKQAFNVDMDAKLVLSTPKLMAMFGQKEADIGLMSAPDFARIESRQSGLVNPIMIRSGDEKGYSTRSALLVRSDSNIRSVDDLEGKQIAWVSRQSAEGYIVPNIEMIEQGYDTNGMFSRHIFSGSQDESINLLVNGDVDVVAVAIRCADGAPNSLLQMNSNGHLTNGVVGVSPGSYMTEGVKIIWRSETLPKGAMFAGQHTKKDVSKVMFELMNWVEINDPVCSRAMQLTDLSDVSDKKAMWVPIRANDYEVFLKYRQYLDTRQT